MRIFRDIISGDELCSDTFPMELVDDVVWKVKGKMTSENCDIDDRLIGGNASAEGGGDEGADASVVSGINVVMNHKLVPSPMAKKEYMKYIKGYMKAVKDKLKDNEVPQAEVDIFTKNVQKFVKDLLASYGDWELYIGESYNPDAMLPLLKWDEEIPYFYFFKHGLEMEKV